MLSNYWQGVREEWRRFRPLLELIVHYGFVVYPRRPEEIDDYVPEEQRASLPAVGAIGLIAPGSSGQTGIVLGIPQQIERLEQLSAEDLQQLLAQVEEYISVPYFALAGRLPALFVRRRIPLGEKFVKGELGTLWAIEDSVDTIARFRGISPAERVGIFGLGYTGSQLLADFPRRGFLNLLGLDPRLRRPRLRRGMVLTNDLKEIASCKLVVVVSAQGEDLRPAIPFMQQDVVVLDDTNPEIPVEMARQIPGVVYKVALGLEGARFDPLLPGFQQDWIPGCAAEAIVRAMGFQPTTQTEFNRVAREIALRALLTPVR